MQKNKSPRFVLAALSLIFILNGCGGNNNSPATIDSSSGSTNISATNDNAKTLLDAAISATGRGFSSVNPWVTYYGDAKSANLTEIAQKFRIINIDADPDNAAFTTEQITQLKAGGNNKVLSYLDIGSCENYRSYWKNAPGFVSCKSNTAAKIGKYSGYSDETWMNLSNKDYQNLIVNYVAPRLAAQGIDGFWLDNMEIVEHGTKTKNGPCDTTCSQGGLDLVRLLRAKYPNMLIVMNGATSNITLKGITGGVSFPSLLDGVVREEVYSPSYDATGEQQLLAWKNLHLTPGNKQFQVGTLDYVGSCSDTTGASEDYQKSLGKGFSPYVSDASSGLQKVCYWSF